MAEVCRDCRLVATGSVGPEEVAGVLVSPFEFEAIASLRVDFLEDKFGLKGRFGSLGAGLEALFGPGEQVAALSGAFSRMAKRHLGKALGKIGRLGGAEELANGLSGGKDTCAGKVDGGIRFGPIERAKVVNFDG